MEYTRTTDHHVPSRHHVSLLPSASALGVHGQSISPTLLKDKLNAIPAVIEQPRSSLETEIDTVASDLTLLQTDHRKLENRVTAMKQILDMAQPKIQTMNSTFQTLADYEHLLKSHIEDAEGRSRRNNVHVVGLPGGQPGLRHNVLYGIMVVGAALSGSLVTLFLN
ncbi:hypothetical protein NDU88_003242 [Pleurodeles waltl]|uniref:Uncharacterized protein n=1 Tax=Pleurodeles waltl TaxID=8319 RepID=A0AAV7RDB9_PLEWA|nr:hypothetical protein NDU88_003242 [Pleurodeles waltl]